VRRARPPALDPALAAELEVMERRLAAAGHPDMAARAAQARLTAARDPQAAAVLVAELAAEAAARAPRRRRAR
jgi:hypothetical protein